MSRSSPWQVGNVPGWVVAQNLKGETLERALKKATSPLLIVSKMDDFEQDIAGKYMKKLAERGCSFVATPWAVKLFHEHNVSYDAIMGLVEVTDRLVKGGPIGDKPGDFDLVLFFGGNYNHQSQMLSSIKNFATHLTTISLTRYKQPNATYSFPNLRENRWTSEMESVLEAL